MLSVVLVSVFENQVPTGQFEGQGLALCVKPLSLPLWRGLQLCREHDFRCLYFLAS